MAKEPNIPADSIRRGQIYTFKQVQDILGIARATLQAMIDDGLKFSKPKTKTQYFLGDQIISFMFDEK